MWRRLALGLLVAAFPALAAAQSLQNFIVPTAPASTSNNQAASTAFVQNSASDVPLSGYCSNLSVPSADITACLTTAIVAAQARGACVVLPSTPPAAGTLVISSPIVLGNGSITSNSTLNNYCIKGAGSGGTVGTVGTYLTYTGTIGTDMFTVSGPIQNVFISGLNLNGNASAGRILDLKAVQFYRLDNLYIANCTIICIDVQGIAATGGINGSSFQGVWNNLYVTTASTPNSIAINFDGSFANGFDVNSTIINSLLVFSQGTAGIGIRFRFADNLLLNEVSSTATSCDLQYDANNSGTGGNSFPTSIHFGKYSGSANTCTAESGGKTIGVNTFVNFSTLDGATVPTHANLRGFTQANQAFGNFAVGGLGAAADTLLTVNANTVAVGAGVSPVHILGANATPAGLLLDGFGAVAQFFGRRADGTAAVPSALQAGDQIFTLGAFGYGSTAYSADAAAIIVNAQGTWTDASQGTNIRFYTTPVGSSAASLAERMRVWASGGLSVNNTTDPGIGEVSANGFTATAVAPTVGAGQIGYGSTITAAGTGTCPTTINTSISATQAVAGCAVVNIAGTARNVPFF